MAEDTSESVQHLFKRWRNGDREAGQVMAQQFSDWYYAITASRLGDTQGREPLEQSCDAFIQGIASVTRSSDLVDWAHHIVDKEVRQVGGRAPGGDYPNALTGNRPPSQLLDQARQGMDHDQARLIALTYEPTVPLDELSRIAEEHGGMPLAILRARYALKRWLRDNAQIEFTAVPEQPNLDCGPLPLYEATRMADEHEEAFFEKWLVTNVDLCRDVAEFATFAHALRAGAFAPALLAPAPTPGPVPSQGASNSNGPSIEVYKEPGRSTPLLLLGLAVAGVVFLLVIIVILFVFVLN